MIRRKSLLLNTRAVPTVAAVGLALGSGVMIAQTALAASIESGYGKTTAQLQVAQARDGNIILAACNPCKPTNPCAAKNPSNPCAAKNPCGASAATNPCNPCAAKSPANPCAAKSPSNPCAAKKY